MNTKYKFDSAVDQLGALLLTVSRELQTEAWTKLYYAQPNTSESHLRGFETKARTYLAELDCDSLIAAAVAREVGHIILLGTLVREEKALKKAIKPARKVSSDTGRYSYPTTPSSKIAGAPQDIITGDYLLVSYGPHGTQLVFVSAAVPQRKTLTIRRLFNRGTGWVVWRDSTISREDKRILGRSNRVPQDPLP